MKNSPFLECGGVIVENVLPEEGASRLQRTVENGDDIARIPRGGTDIEEVFE